MSRPRIWARSFWICHFQRGSLPHHNHIALMFPLFHHTSISKVNCNTLKREGSSERNYSWLCENWPQMCCFEGSKAQISPPSQGPEQSLGLHIHPGTHAHTHTHTPLQFVFFFLSKKIKIYCPLKKKKKFHPALGNCDTDWVLSSPTCKFTLPRKESKPGFRQPKHIFTEYERTTAEITVLYMESTTRFTPLITILPTSTRTRGASAQCPSSWGKQGRDWARIATRNTAVCIIIISLKRILYLFCFNIGSYGVGKPQKSLQCSHYFAGILHL